MAQTSEVNEQTPEGCTALTVAAEEGHADVIRILVDARANVDQVSGLTPQKTGTSSGSRQPAISLAARENHSDGVLALLEGHASIDARDSHGRTALWIACAAHADEAASVLIEAQANLEAANSKMVSAVNIGSTPLMVCAAQGSVRVAEALLDANANVHCRNSIGPTPLLHCAFVNKSAPLVSLIVEAEADVNECASFPQASMGVTPLLAAVFLNNPDVVEALMEAEADLGLRTTSLLGIHSNALDVARVWGRTRVLPLLEGADEA